MDSRITSVNALQVLDSRGIPTVSVRVKLQDGSLGTASVPSGASTGRYEAIELRDGDCQRYRGRGVLKAVANIQGVIQEMLIGEDAMAQARLDAMMLSLDGSDNVSCLGANAVLGVSLAVAQAAAASQGLELYEYLGNGRGFLLPVPRINVINGGVLADNSLDIQEFMLVPHGAPSFSEAVRMGSEIFYALGVLLRDDGYETGVGDEGGYAPRLESTRLAFDLLLKAIERTGYRPGEDVSLALHVAASELCEEAAEQPVYRFSRSGLGEFSSAELVKLYEQWIDKYPIVSVEDGLGEHDWSGWKELTSRLGRRVQLVGDDVFVTNYQRLQRGIEENVANALLIKLNQVGTVSAALKTTEMARRAGYSNVVSNRSGETGDTSICDLAVAINAGHIKIGSICRGERTEKYNRLLWIEHRLAAQAAFSGSFSGGVKTAE